MLSSLCFFILARGSSTRFPQKNIAPLLGRPLISYTLEHVARYQLSIPSPPPVFILTDSEAVLNAVTKDPITPNGTMYQQEPEEAKDFQEFQGIERILCLEEEQGRAYDAVIVLGADCPIRPITTFDSLRAKYQTIKHLDGCHIVQTCKRVPHTLHPNLMGFLTDEGLEPLFPDATVISNVWPQFYCLCDGGLMVRRRDIPAIAAARKLLDFSWIVHPCPIPFSFSVHVPEDMPIAASLLR